jgi:hypothetical protein
METSSKDLFKKYLDKAYTQPGVELNSSTMKDNLKYKQSFTEEKLEGGVADNKTLKDIIKKHAKKGNSVVSLIKKQYDMGVKVEMEHTKDIKKAKEIALDHLWEDPNYYSKLKKIETKEEKDIGKSAKKQFAMDLQKDPDYLEFKKRSKYFVNRGEYSFGAPNVSSEDPYVKKRKYSRVGKGDTTEATGSGSSGAFVGPIGFKDSEFVRKSFAETPKLKEEIEKTETKEATTSSSVGGYESPSMWAKSTKKKDWGPSRKTQLPGGSFVKVKKKCTKFPYCNQGDINALKISKNESVKEAIQNVSKKYGLSENVIINILEHEYSKINTK